MQLFDIKQHCKIRSAAVTLKLSSIDGANDLNVTTGGDFTNQVALMQHILDILLNDATGSFTNTGSASADTFTLSVAGDFDYVADYLNGTITTNTFNLNVGGDFSNNDSANDFTWGANDSLTVSGSASIDAADFKNNGVFNVGDLNITAAGDFDNYATINADSFNVTAGDDFGNGSSTATINADFNNSCRRHLNSNNNCNHQCGNFNVTAERLFYNVNATISVNYFNVIAGNFFNLFNATIGSLNEVFGGGVIYQSQNYLKLVLSMQQSMRMTLMLPQHLKVTLATRAQLM